jgi:hypothetical protein
MEAAVGRLNRRERGGRAITRTEKATSEECEKQWWLKQEGTHVPVTWMDADSGIKKREDARRRRLRQAPLEKRQTTRFLCSYTFKNWQGLARRRQSGYKTSSTRLWWVKHLSHVLSSHDFWCVNYCFTYSKRNPVFMWSMRYMLQRQDGPSGAEPCHRTGWGSQNARFFRRFWLAAKIGLYLFTVCWRTA